MSFFPGALIRRQRLARSLSQEGLCRGICAVSYLSKIEQGKVQPDVSILRPLLERLGIRYETDPAFLTSAHALIERLYEGFYDGDGLFGAPDETLSALRERWDDLCASRYFLDALLLRGALEPEHVPPPPEEYASAMDDRQYELLLLLRFRAGQRAAAETLLQRSSCALYPCAVGVADYRAGRYLDSLVHLERAYTAAAREGRAYLMLVAKSFLGMCCSDAGQLPLMLEHLQVARKLALSLKGQEAFLSDIDYNIACTYLESGQAEKALELFRSPTLSRTPLYYHKLAIALEQLGRTEEALAALDQGLAALTPETLYPDVTQEALLLVRCRLLHPDFLQRPEYCTAMTALFQRMRAALPAGFARFHLPYMLAVLEQQRRYKEAYQLAQEFSSLSRSS